MKNTLLVTASIAALIAGVGLASAQGMNEHREAPAATAPQNSDHAKPAPTAQAPDKAKPAPTAQAPDKAKPAPTAQAPDKAKPAPTAQAPNKAKPAPTAQAPDKAKPAPTAQAPNKAKPAPTAQTPDQAKPAPTAQAPNKAKPAPTAQTPDQAKPAPTAQAPNNAKTAPTAQAPDRATGSNRETVGQGSGRGDVSNEAAHGGAKSAASMPLSTEQHAKIRETLRAEKTERLTNVQFSISVGEAIPRTVHLYRLPPRIVEYAPQYRDYEYILVGDDILIIDPRTHRIIAVIPA